MFGVIDMKSHRNRPANSFKGKNAVKILGTQLLMVGLKISLLEAHVYMHFILS